MLVINNKYYFNNEGKKIIPTEKEIREHYKLDDKFQVVCADFPYEGYGVANGFFGCQVYPYKTREHANAKREEMVQAEIEYYKNLVR